MTDEEIAEATWRNEFPNIDKQVELQKRIRPLYPASYSPSEVKSAYIAGYLRAIKERS